MTDYDLKLKVQIMLHEGIKYSAYQDSLGFLTIGCGRLIDERKGGKLSTDEIMYLLANDISKCKKELELIDWYLIQDEVRKGVLVELSFNMGLTNLLKFHNMILALKEKDYLKASAALYDSLWAKQVQSSRVKDIRYRLEKGQYP